MQRDREWDVAYRAAALAAGVPPKVIEYGLRACPACKYYQEKPGSDVLAVPGHCLHDNHFCNTERAEVGRARAGYCGPEGKWWEPK